MQRLTTYLNFDGNCKEAMDFYHKSIGGDLTMMRVGDMPGHGAPRDDNRIMHSRITKGEPLLMASDTMPGSSYQAGDNFSICIDCESMEEIQRLFAGIGEGGTVTMPLQDQFWGAHFGMLKDKFGIHWMFNYDTRKAG